MLFKGMWLVVPEGACGAVLELVLLEVELELVELENGPSTAAITITDDVSQQEVWSAPQQYLVVEFGQGVSCALKFASYLI